VSFPVGQRVARGPIARRWRPAARLRLLPHTTSRAMPDQSRTKFAAFSSWEHPTCVSQARRTVFSSAHEASPSPLRSERGDAHFAHPARSGVPWRSVSRSSKLKAGLQCGAACLTLLGQYQGNNGAGRPGAARGGYASPAQTQFVVLEVSRLTRRASSRTM
jgi:hypothetical protein